MQRRMRCKMLSILIHAPFNGAFPRQSGLSARLVSHARAIRLTKQTDLNSQVCVYSHCQGIKPKEHTFSHRLVWTHRTKARPFINGFSIRVSPPAAAPRAVISCRSTMVTQGILSHLKAIGTTSEHNPALLWPGSLRNQARIGPQVESWSSIEPRKHPDVQSFCPVPWCRYPLMPCWSCQPPWQRSLVHASRSSGRVSVIPGLPKRTLAWVKWKRNERLCK